MIAGNVAHRVVRTVGCHRLPDYSFQLAHRELAVNHRLAYAVILVEVKLCVEHACLDVHANQVGRTVRLADHPYMPFGEACGNLVPEHAPVAFGYMLARVVAETVKRVVLQPEQCRVSHCLTHFGNLQVERGDMYIKPGCQARLVPQLEVPATIGQYAVGYPLGVLLYHGRVDMQVVGYIIQHDMQAVCMGCVQHGAQFVARAEAVIDLVVVYRPVAVVARELRVRLARVVLVAVLERITSPCIGRVLRDR